MIDQKIRWEVVRGRLPIAINLDQSEIASMTVPTPFFSLFARVAYLPQLLPGLHRHFESFMVPSYGRYLDPWLDFNGTPLDWRVPMGVLFDVMCPTNHQLPVKLTIHFNTLPNVDSDQRRNITLPSWFEFQQHHVNAMKQSLYIFHGHSKAFGSLNNEVQLRLFDAIRRVDQRLFDSIWFSSLLGSDLTVLKRVPIRVYLSGHAKLGRLTSYATMDVHLSTLHEWLTEFLPIDMSPESLDIIVQGVVISSLSAPLMWVALIATCLDGFLHITLSYDFRRRQNYIKPKEIISHSPRYDPNQTTVVSSTNGSDADSLCIPIIRRPNGRSQSFQVYRRSLHCDFFRSSLDAEVVARLRALKTACLRKRAQKTKQMAVSK